METKDRSLTNIGNLNTFKDILNENDPQIMEKKKIGLRGIVSKKKKRFNNEKYDLDLAYITDRIIAMGFPSKKIEGIYRNPMKQVQNFMEEYHEDNYKIYNLCSERTYDHSKFKNRVSHYPFDDHNPPKFELFKSIFEDIDKHFETDEKSIVAIHCKAGKGRTGTVIAGYFLYRYKSMGVSAQESLDFFSERRTQDGKGVTIKSQKRYVFYLEKILEMHGTIPKVISSPRILKKISICGTMGYVAKKEESFPSFDIICPYYDLKFESKKETVHNLNNADDYNILTFTLDLEVNKDIIFQFYYDKKRTEKMCSFWLNSFFVGATESLGLEDLDGVKKTMNKFPKNFKIMVYFKESSQEQKLEMSSPNPTKEGNNNNGGSKPININNSNSSPLNNRLKSSSPLSPPSKTSYMNSGNISGTSPLSPQSKTSYMRNPNSPTENEVMERESKFSPTVTSMICHSCNTPVSSNAVKANNSYFHKTCFLCSVCNMYMKSAYFVKGKLFCEEHSPNNVTCNKCGKKIIKDYFTFQGEKIHVDCLKCHKCTTILDPKNFYTVLEQPFCEKCSLNVDEEELKMEIKKEKLLKSSSRESVSPNLSRVTSNKPNFNHLPRAFSLYNYTAKNKDELSFKKGDVIVVVKDSVDKGWKVGFLESDPKALMGNFPSNYVKY